MWTDAAHAYHMFIGGYGSPVAEGLCIPVIPESELTDECVWAVVCS